MINLINSEYVEIKKKRLNINQLRLFEQEEK